MPRRKSASNNLLKVVFGAITLFALGTAFVVFSTFFYQNPTSVESQAMVNSTPISGRNSMDVKDTAGHLVGTIVYDTSVTSLSGSLIPRTKAYQPTIVAPKGTYSSADRAGKIDVEFTSEIVKTLSIQTSTKSDFAPSHVLSTQQIDFGKAGVDWKNIRWLGIFWHIEYPFEPGASVYWRVRVDEFTDTFGGKVYTQQASDWSTPLREQFSPTYTVVRPTLVSPKSGSSVGENPTMKWKKATDNAQGNQQFLCVSASKHPYGNCEILMEDVSRVTTTVLPSLPSLMNRQSYYWQVCDNNKNATYFTGNECSSVFRFVYSVKPSPTPVCRTNVQCFKAPCPCLP